MSEETAPAEDGQAAEAAPAEEGQATETTWYEGANDETIGYLQNKGWDKDPLKAISSYQELEKFNGADADHLMKIPKDMAEDGALDSIYDRLGRPEAADKYTLDLGDIQVDQTRMSMASEVAHKAGLNNAQFEALAKADAEYTAAAQETYNKEVAQQQEIEYQTLQKEWGPKAAEREELARRGLRSMLPQGVDKDSLTAKIEDAIGTANTLRLFANVGEKMSKEDVIHDSEGTHRFGYTKEQATADRVILMDELAGDIERRNIYNSNKGPDVAKMKRLNEMISG